MGVLRARVGSNWIDIGGSGDAIWVDPNAPADPNIELWYDTDAANTANWAIPGRNLLDNGQLAVKQRTVTSLAGGGFLADRWRIQNSGTGATALNYGTTSAFGVALPVGRPRPGNIQYIQMTTAEAAGSLAPADFILWQQAIEGQFLQHLNWGTPDAQPVTWSFDVYSTIATTFVAELYRNEPTGRSISKLVPVPAGWSTQILSYPGDTTTVITNDEAARLYCYFWIGSGSTNAGGTLNTTWNTNVNANKAAGVSNAFAATVNNVFTITNAQLEVGATATPYEVRPYDRELIKAMRYYRQTPTAPNGEGAIFGYGTAGSLVGYTVAFPVRMRATPTVTIAGTWALTNCAMNYAINGPDGYLPYASPTATGMVQVYSNSNGYWIFGAEI